MCLLQYPHLDQSYQQLQLALSEAGAGLNASSASLVVASRGSNDMLAAAAKKFADDFLKMLDAAMAVAGAAKVNVACLPGEKEKKRQKMIVKEISRLFVL